MVQGWKSWNLKPQKNVYKVIDRGLKFRSFEKSWSINFTSILNSQDKITLQGCFMASGRKNYFRHSFNAHSDPKIMTLIEKHGKEGYFNFFVLLELCGEQATDSVPESFVFHPRTLCNNLLLKRNKLATHLLRLEDVGLILLVRKENITGMYEVCTDNAIELLVPNFPKYLGRYQSKIQTKTPNKIKEKEIKEKESKLNTEFDFETLYQKYPNKRGKKRGMQICGKEIKTQEQFDQLEKAIDNYVLETENKTTEYIKHFSTFMNNWHDYTNKQEEMSHDEYFKRKFEREGRM